MTKINYQALREAAEKATALNLDTAQVKRGNDGYLECPCYEGAGYVEEESDFCNIDGVALGVQFYGIGEHYGLAESYLRAANPATVLALLDELAKWQQESSAWQAVAEKQLALAADAEKRIAELESLTAPRLPQPAPVSVPEVVGWEDVPEEITEDDIALASAWAHGFNQCRSAMLQGEEPVTDNTNQQFESLSRGDK